MSTTLTLVQQSAADLRALLDKDAYRKRFAEILDKRAPQFMASIVNVVSATPALAECDKSSIIGSCIIAATLDLPIEKSLGFAYVVPYKGVATFQLGYKGLIQLALRSGQYAGMKEAMVNAEAFKGYDDIGEPIIDWAVLDESEEPVGYVFAWRTINGFKKIVYWSRDKVEKHARRYSRTWGNANSTWTTNFDAMALKTVIRAALSKYGILSVELQRGLVAEEQEVRVTEEGVETRAAITEGAVGGAAQPEQPIGSTIRRGRGRPPKDVTGTGAVEPTAAGVATQAAPAAPGPIPVASPPSAAVQATTPPESATAVGLATDPNAEELANEESRARQQAIDGIQDAMIELGVSEAKLLAWVVKLPDTPAGLKSVWDLPTAQIQRMKFALPALSVGRTPAVQ